MDCPICKDSIEDSEIWSHLQWRHGFQGDADNRELINAMLEVLEELTILGMEGPPG